MDAVIISSEPMVGNLVSPSLAAASHVTAWGTESTACDAPTGGRHAGVLGAPRDGISIALRHRARQGGGSRQPGMGSTVLAMLSPDAKDEARWFVSFCYYLGSPCKLFLCMYTLFKYAYMHVYRLEVYSWVFKFVCTMRLLTFAFFALNINDNLGLHIKSYFL